MLTARDHEALASFALVPPEQRAAMRAHARHWRNSGSDVPNVDAADCREAACVRYRERIALMASLRVAFAGPRHLAGVLKISVPQAATILIKGPKDDDEMVKLRAIMDRE